MARYYSLSPSTFADDFRAALEDYYGSGVTIESASGNTIVFTCPAICDKVLKFEKFNSGFLAYFGDDSSKMTQFTNSYSGSNNTGLHLVLSEAFLLLESTVLSDTATSAVVGRLTNGRHLVTGGTTSDNPYYTGGNKSYFTDDTVYKAICIISPYQNNIKHGGKMCLWPAFVACDGEIETDVDTTFASIPGLFVTFAQSGERTGGSNFYLSKGAIYSEPSSYRCCNTRKYIELEVAE